MAQSWLEAISQPWCKKKANDSLSEVREGKAAKIHSKHIIHIFMGQVKENVQTNAISPFCLNSMIHTFIFLITFQIWKQRIRSKKKNVIKKKAHMIKNMWPSLQVNINRLDIISLISWTNVSCCYIQSDDTVVWSWKYNFFVIWHNDEKFLIVDGNIL